MQGHDLSGIERFHPETRHMITLEVQKQCFVGFKGERFRFFLSDEGYRNAKHSEQQIISTDFQSAPIITGEVTLPLRWLRQLPPFVDLPLESFCSASYFKSDKF